MALSLSSTVKYVPEFGGERKRWESAEIDNPMIFHILKMGATAFRSFAAKVSAKRDDDGPWSPEMDALHAEIFEKYLVKIDNLTIDGEPIVDGKQFYGHVAIPSELHVEIEKAIYDQNVVTEEESKN